MIIPRTTSCNIIEDAAQSIYSTYDGKYLGTRENGNLYHVIDYNIEGINQNELEWSVISQGDNKFSIMSTQTGFKLIIIVWGIHGPVPHFTIS